MLYVLKTGATWRDLPDSFPNWSAVYYYFGSWSKKDESGKSAIDKALDELMLGERK
ncbi:MAG: transposase [Clostridiales bacterium]|nr:transposase [Clostridiales bacterium]